MDVLTSETCWALNNEIIKQVTSSWSLFIPLSGVRLRLWGLIYDIHIKRHVHIPEVHRFFQKPTIPLIVLDARRVMWSKFWTEDPHLLGATDKNLVAWATWPPGFAPPWPVSWEHYIFERIFHCMCGCREHFWRFVMYSKFFYRMY